MRNKEEGGEEEEEEISMKIKGEWLFFWKSCICVEENAVVDSIVAEKTLPSSQ